MAKVGETKGELAKQVYNLANDPEVSAQIEALLGPAESAAEGTAPVVEAPAPAETASAGAPGAVAEVVVETPPVAGEALEGTPAPVEYFGVDLSDIPEDARQPLIDELRERDNLINRLLRERAEGASGAPAEVVTPAEEQPLTDEAILRALGQDPELADPESSKALIMLGRQLIDSQSQIAALAEKNAIAETQFYWENTLAGLEKQFGDVPVSRERFFEYAIEHNIGDPALAYWAVVGPTRAEVTVEVKKRKEATAEAKKAAATLRPGAAETLTAAALTSLNTKDATKEAALQVLKDLGLG